MNPPGDEIENATSIVFFSEFNSFMSMDSIVVIMKIFF